MEGSSKKKKSNKQVNKSKKPTTNTKNITTNVTSKLKSSKPKKKVDKSMERKPKQGITSTKPRYPSTDDAETRRRLLAEAAEKRSKELENRGIKDPAKLQRMQKKAEELERREQEALRSGNSNAPLRWQVN